MNGTHVNEGITSGRRVSGAADNRTGTWRPVPSQAVAGSDDALPTPQLQQNVDRAGRRARRLGWFSVGLGVTQLVAPRALGRAIGVGDGPGTCLAMRAVGLRELMAGFGILSGRKPTRWLRSRVLGDLMDLAVLGVAFRGQAPRKFWQREGAAVELERDRLPVALLAVAGVTALDLLTSRQLSRGRKQGVLPQVNGPVELISVITINRSPQEVYAFWRDFQNLSRFMTRVESVQVYDQVRSRWTVNVAGKSLEWDAEITQDRPNQSISWRTLKNADVANSGEVRFLRAAGGRGTEVCVRIEVTPPAGMLGHAAAKMGRLLPEQEVANDLRRLKQILEIGEVVNSDASIHQGPHPARPSNARSSSPERRSRK